MKKFLRWTLYLASAWAVAQSQSTLRAQMYGSGAHQDVVLTIHADGSCEVESVSVLARQAAEQQVRMSEQMQNMEEDEETGDVNQMTNSRPAANTNALTDEQLKEKYGEMMSTRFSRMDGGSNQSNVTLDKDNVTVTTKTRFASIKDTLSAGSGLLSSGGIYFRNIRFEQDTNGHLLVTLTPLSRRTRDLGTMRTEWKMEGLKSLLKFVFPGKVLSSGFPETQTNATWLTVDSTKDETLDALVKLYGGPIVITAEAAGLTLKEPLDSNSLQRRGQRPAEMGDDLPITAGGAGFVAQAEGIMTTTLHVFPGGGNFFKDGNIPLGGQVGTMVRSKLFPPKGRTLQSVTDVKLLAATDDKGRPVAAAEHDGEEEMATAYVRGDTGGARENNSADIQFHLQLPQPDAQAIDELNGEAVAVTAGSWKELTLTNITQTATNEFDLGDVLAGAKLVVTKFSNKNNMLDLQVRLKGPAAVRNLKVAAKVPGTEQSSFGNSWDMNVKTTGGETTRNIRINASMFDENGAKASGPIQILIRYPQDLRRERVPLKLKGLDLL